VLDANRGLDEAPITLDFLEDSLSANDARFSNGHAIGAVIHGPMRAAPLAGTRRAVGHPGGAQGRRKGGTAESGTDVKGESEPRRGHDSLDARWNSGRRREPRAAHDADRVLGVMLVELATGTHGPIVNRAVHGRSDDRADAGSADRWTKLSLAESAR
jgi:hypothetical protein